MEWQLDIANHIMDLVLIKQCLEKITSNKTVRLKKYKKTKKKTLKSFLMDFRTDFSLFGTKDKQEFSKE